MAIAKKDFDTKVEASMKCARRCGNMYTASLYGGLSSLVSSIEPKELLGKRISMFAYGSGIASSFFTIKVKGDTTRIKENLDLVERLAAMQVVPCQEYVDALKVCRFPVLWPSFTNLSNSFVRSIILHPRTLLGAL